MSRTIRLSGRISGPFDFRSIILQDWSLLYAIKKPKCLPLVLLKIVLLMLRKISVSVEKYYLNLDIQYKPSLSRVKWMQQYVRLFEISGKQTRQSTALVFLTPLHLHSARILCGDSDYFRDLVHCTVYSINNRCLGRERNFILCHSFIDNTNFEYYCTYCTVKL